MHVQRFHDPAEFIAATTPLLLRREAENNFFLGMMNQWHRIPDAVLCAVTDDDGEVAAVATMTPPWHMLVTRAAADAVVALASFLTNERIPVPGVQGDSATAAAFARQWTALHDMKTRAGKGLGIYVLDRVIPPPGVSGTFRLATNDDLDLLLAWGEAFLHDIGEPPRNDDARDKLLEAIAQQRRFFWCDPAERPVCSVGVAGPTPNGIRVNVVYTPPQHRRRGYASAAAAAASQRMLDRGRKFCFLYTDLANPTSNKIYRAIGYKHVCDQTQVFFEQ